MTLATIDARNVANQVRGAFQVLKVDDFPVGPESYEVNLRLIAEDRLDSADLDDLTVIGRNSALVPLFVVVEIKEVRRGWARINRVNRQHAVTIQGDVDRRLANAQELLSLAKTEFFQIRWNVILSCTTKCRVRAMSLPRSSSLSCVMCYWV